jgi:hypothetical protein
MSKKLSGGCVCGATRYRLTSAPLFAHACHCSDCRRQSGAPFIVNAMIEADRIVVAKGQPEPTPAPSSTKSAHHVFRCPDCRAPLWSRYGVKAPMRYLRTASLDEPDAVPPRAHIFVRSKAAWLTLNDGLPQFKTWYDRRKIWPAESLARLAAARESQSVAGARK